MKEKKYVAEKIENFQAEIPVEEYMKECVDVATFLEFCKECSNYGKLWCCPPYTFDVEKDYWNKYRKIQIMGRKLYLPKELTSQSYIKNEQWKITEEFLLPYKEELEQEIGDGHFYLTIGATDTSCSFKMDLFISELETQDTSASISQMGFVFEVN